MNKKIVRFSSLLIAVLMVLSLCACGEEEETYDYKSPLPTTTEDILARFNEAVAGTKKGNPGISYSIDQGAGMSGEQKDKCENEYVKAAFKTFSRQSVRRKLLFSQTQTSVRLIVWRIRTTARAQPM